MEEALQLIANGVVIGSVIAVAAVGLTLVFGVLRLINFAHGDFLTLGAFVAVVGTGFGLPLYVAAIPALLVGAAFAGGLEKVLWGPLRRRGASTVNLLIISIGLALVVRYTIFWIFGSGVYRYGPVSQRIDFGLFALTPQDVVIIVGSAAALVGVALMLQKTRIGKAMRALSDNRDLAEASGIDVERITMITWLIAGVLTAYGGIMLGLQGRVFANMGWFLLLLIFAGVILGGIGSAYGAMIGSMIIGITQELATHSAIGLPSDLKTGVAFLALIVVLLVRPQGIMGRKQAL
ncbi:branched-chain amino acid ABC transporter permease [Rubrobacter xylanophilus]|uniref:Branched-chain amino acid ABC transporter permease n=1 Tax=Rubrobacter xylanophilus TaxID=49319 RepID=A0A510HL98_9ACTN|nr:branched-chain amino acid ABC transporter permease [Rubrobacter xylanophilus]BBL80779.1 branched-chain amino acid ABC transporter permease [Rubrobacter xylanophilus]